MSRLRAHQRVVVRRAYRGARPPLLDPLAGPAPDPLTVTRYGSNSSEGDRLRQTIEAHVGTATEDHSTESPSTTERSDSDVFAVPEPASTPLRILRHT